MKMTELDTSVRQDIAEGWSQKYKSSINCSHPKGFSQKEHCAGKKKHNESIEIEMTCPDCGMCQSHGTLNEIKKGAKDSNGFTKCWSGYHAAGTKKGKNGKTVRNCVPNEGVAEGRRDYDDNRTGFGRGHDHRGLEQELAHETNNYAVAIDGKTWKVFSTKSHAESIARKLQSKGKKASVHPTGAPVSETLQEFASAPGSMTTAANVGVGAVYKNKPVKQPKNKDGTAKNALDMKGANLLGGGSIKR